METEKGLFFVYLRERGKAIACLCLFTGIFAGTFLLYHVPWQAAAYPAALCLGLGVLLLLRDYRRFRRVHEAYRRLEQLPELTREQLPQGKSQTERDCAALLEKQLEDMARLQTASADRFTTQTDYFSAWAHQIKTPIAAMGLKLQNEDSPLARGLRGDLNRIAQYVEMAMTYQRLDTVTYNGSSYVALENCSGILPSDTERWMMLAQGAQGLGVQAGDVITLPMNMPESYRLTTHYESGIGVAVAGHVPEVPCTIFKTNAALDRYFAKDVEIVGNLQEPTLCRTQIRLKLDDFSYFLTRPIYNHHLVTLGQHEKALAEFFHLIG